jgi:hypothetical protein
MMQQTDGVVLATETLETTIVPKPMVNKVDMTAAEKNWSVNDLMKRPIFLGEAVWNGVQTQGSCIYTQFLPQAFFNQPLFAQSFGLFNLSRFKMTVTFTMTGTKFHQGCIMASWRPMVANDAAHLKLINAFYVTPHAFLRADRPNTVKFEVPFKYDTAWYPHYMNAVDEPFGSIGLFVFAPLIFAAGATPQLSISVSAQFDSLEFHMPRTPFITNNPISLLAAAKDNTTDPEALPARPLSSRTVLPPIVAPQASQESATVAGAVSSKPTVIGRPLPLPTLRRDVVVSYRDMFKKSYQVSRVVTPIETISQYTSVFPSFNMMDATALFHPWMNATPLAPVANMYRLARGSLRYEIDFQLAFPKNTANASIVTNANVQAFAMFMPKYFPQPRSSDKTPVYYFANGGSSSPTWWPSLPYVTGGPTGSDAFPFADVASLFRISQGPYGRLAAADPSQIRQINFSPYHMITPMTASADGFSCSLALEIPFVHHRDAYRIPNIWTTTNQPDNQWVTDGPIAAHGTTRNWTPYAEHSLFGPAHSPGTIVYGLYSTTPLAYTTPNVPMHCTTIVNGSLGDDFRFGCLSNMDYTWLNGNFFTDTAYMPGQGCDMFNTGVPPALKSELPFPGVVHQPPPTEVTYRSVIPQGNTTSTTVTQHFAGAVSGTVPVNVTGDKWDNKLDLSIPTSGMDKPSCTLQLPAGKMFQFNWRNSDTGIWMGERQALKASDTNEARPGDFGTEQDEMAFEVIRQVPGVCLATSWDTTQVQGTALFHCPISPVVLTYSGSATTAFSMPAYDVGYQTYMLEKTCIPFLYWRGALRYRFRLFASGFHTGKLFLAINYHPYRSGQPVNLTQLASFQQIIPADFNSALSQYGIYIDLSEENHDIEFEVPYVSSDVFTAVNHFVSNMKNNIGTLSCYIVQPLVAVPGIATSIQGVLEIWAGDDFQTHTLCSQAAIWSNQSQPTIA